MASVRVPCCTRLHVRASSVWDAGDELHKRSWMCTPKRSDVPRAALRIKLREVQRDLDKLYATQQLLRKELTDLDIAGIIELKKEDGPRELPDL
jgi:hypothetical protein